MSKRKKKVEQELSEEQLEAVAGGVNPVAGPEPHLEDDAAAKRKGKGSGLLLACVSGQHIKDATITAR
jgi:hypothetical protein